MLIMRNFLINHTKANKKNFTEPGAIMFNIFFVFNVLMNYAGHYWTVRRPLHTSIGAVMRVTHVLESNPGPRC